MSEETLVLIGFCDDREIRYELTEGRHLIGRSDECGLQVQEPSISRRHAEIENDGKTLTLKDLGSYNGSRVNGARVEGSAEIAEGDQIAFAHVTFRLTGQNADESTPAEAAGEGSRTAVVSAGQESLLADATMVHSGEEVSWEEIQKLKSDRQDNRSRLFQVFAEAGDLLARPRAPEELFEPILDLVETAIGPERTFLLMLDEGEPEPVIKASRLRGARSQDRMILSKTLMNQVIEQKTSFLTADAMSDPQLQAQKSIIMQGIRSALAVPLFNNEEVIGLLYADSSDPRCCYTRDELRVFTLLANVIAVALTNARFRALEAEKRRLDREVDAAREILTQILPASLPDQQDYELYAFQEPCFEVGGDLYDARRLSDGRLAILLGDVTGKGLGAALLVSHIMSGIQYLTDELLDPLTLMTRLNSQVYRSTDSIRFATLFFGILEPDSGRLEYVNAGHNPPLLISEDGGVKEIPSTGVPIGMLEDLPYDSAELTIQPGSLLAIYSDGITEAFNPDEEQYGDDRLLEVLVSHHSKPASEIAFHLLDSVRRFTGDHPAADDITFMMVKRASR